MFMAWHKPTLVNEHTWVINTARVYAVRVNGPGRHGSRGYTLRGTHPARSRLKPGRERLLKKSELVNTKAKKLLFVLKKVGARKHLKKCVSAKVGELVNTLKSCAYICTRVGPCVTDKLF